MQFAGRADNQVKLRGYRVELDEIKLAIEAHDWVKNAAVIVKDDPGTGFQNLVSFVELNAKEAALMDQGNHGAHHQSKESRLQVRAQLSNTGCREDGELVGKPVVELPGAIATEAQRALAFARKTYRFFEGGKVTRADILRLLRRRVTAAGARDPRTMSREELGGILRNFGQHVSDERLLAKYAYASPGSLYATQMYLELAGIAGLAPGYYYYHPVRHQLVLISPAAGGPARARIHFLGKRRAIEPVYRNNIQEVLEIETGHMVGLFEEILPAYGHDIAAVHDPLDVQAHLECAEEDHHLGSFDLVAYGTAPAADDFDVYVQAHPGKVADLPAGQYRYVDGELEPVCGELILKKHVIAINQRVYERASIGVSVVARNREARLHYVDLGRKLQHLQMNDIDLGFMSAGYSSKTGDDLPSAKRLEKILAGCGEKSGPSYFFVGGRVSTEQRLSEGMKEDVVHMSGPAELIKEDLVNFLPDYMLPNRVVVLDRLPLTANGKIDLKALEVCPQANAWGSGRVVVAPRTPTEEVVCGIWTSMLKRESASVHDDFFESGGNSLIAVGLVNKVNRAFGSELPLQILFDAPTIEKLARRIDGADAGPLSRLVPLQAEGSGRPVYCWPGLGGYTMNLKPLADRMGTAQPFYGVQAYGINAGEIPYATIKEMALEDIKAIRRMQPTGPYTLWGYSFGARVAFEAAHQLEQDGERVEHLFLIAPGSPRVQTAAGGPPSGGSAYGDKAFVTILFSVFAGTITGPLLEECLRTVADEEDFVRFVVAHFPHLGAEMVRRTVAIVRLTYSFTYEFHELVERRISAPVSLFKAQGDDYSFIEGASGYSEHPPVVIDLEADHYSLLKDPHVGELVALVRRLLGVGRHQEQFAAVDGNI